MTSKTRLESLKTSLNKMESDEAYAVDFWYEFYQLYLSHLKTQSSEEKKSIDAFLKETAASVEQKSGILLHTLYSLTDSKLSGTWEYDEWLSLCRLLSSELGFIELYNPFFKDPIAYESDEEQNEIIRDRGNRDGCTSAVEPAEIFPETHWWWYHCR